MTNLKTEVTRKQSMRNFAKNEHFLPPDTNIYLCVSGGKKCLFFGKFGVLCFLVISVLRFALLPYYPRLIKLGCYRYLSLLHLLLVPNTGETVLKTGKDPNVVPQTAI